MEISSLSPTLSLPAFQNPSSSVSFSSSKSSLFFNQTTTTVFNSTRQNLALARTRPGNSGRKGFSCSCLFGLGVPEIVVIAGVAALAFGPKQLPEIGRSIGKTIKSFQQAAKEFESELKKEEEPEPGDKVIDAKPAASSSSQKENVGVSLSSSKES